MRLRSLPLAFLVAFAACGGPPPAAPDQVAPQGRPEASDADRPDNYAPRPEKAGPPSLSEGERAVLSSTCAPLLTAMIEGEAEALRILDDGLRDGASDPDGPAVAAALERVKRTSEGLSPPEHERCLALFEKQQRRKQFEHDPAEAEARAAVDRCFKSAAAAFGKQKLAFDEGGGAAAVQSPFCPDDFPVPLRLSQLPYSSKKEDWDTPAWRCLQFGLRTAQRVQVEYAAPLGAGEFNCIARYYPRQGGAPVEYFRGGKQGPGGELVLAPKMLRKKLSPR